jgi:ABC-type transporter Mla subunit MlaD
MEQNAGLTIALILVALAVLMQAGAMIGIWLAVRKIPAQIEAVRADVKQGLDPLAQSVTDIVSTAREPLRTITSNLADISKMLRERTTDVDALVAELVDKSRLQVIRVDQMVSDLVQKVETTADAVQRGVLAPMQEVSAVIAGMRAGLEFLFSRRRTTSVSEAAQDEQLFI